MADQLSPPLPTVNPNDSSSYDLVGSGLFNIRYVDDSYAKGDYFTDDFQIGNVSLQNFTIGLGVDTTMPYGLIGVGYINSEAITQMAPVEYPNLPQALQKGGFIRSVAYSLWLNSLNSSDGSILFGAINTANYQGDLVRIPVLPNQSSKNYTQFSVSIYSLEAESPSGSDRLTTRQFPLAAVLDSGTTLTYLPQDLVESIWQEVGALYDDSVQAAILPCSSSNRPGHFSFLFAGPDGPRINVTMAELVLNVTSGRRPRFDSGPYRGQAACQFGIQNTTQNTYILGDTFLRSAYVVYDLENNEIGLAPANYDAQQANIVAFASKGAPIPSSKSMSVSGSGSGSPPLATQTGFSARDGFQPDSAASATILSRALQWILALVLPLASELVLTY